MGCKLLSIEVVLRGATQRIGDVWARFLTASLKQGLQWAVRVTSCSRSMLQGEERAFRREVGTTGGPQHC